MTSATSSYILVTSRDMSITSCYMKYNSSSTHFEYSNLLLRKDSRCSLCVLIPHFRLYYLCIYVLVAVYSSLPQSVSQGFSPNRLETFQWFRTPFFPASRSSSSRLLVHFRAISSFLLLAFLPFSERIQADRTSERARTHAIWVTFLHWMLLVSASSKQLLSSDGLLTCVPFNQRNLQRTVYLTVSKFLNQVAPGCVCLAVSYILACYHTPSHAPSCPQVPGHWVL